MATKRLKSVPEISKEYIALQDQNPLFDPTKTDARASQELKNIFFKGNGEIFSHNEIVKNIKIKDFYKTFFMI